MADVADSDTARPGHFARSGPPHRMQSGSRGCALRSDRPARASRSAQRM